MSTLSCIMLPMSDMTETRVPIAGHHWTFLTNHAHVLLCLAADPGLRVRDIADRVGITERAALRILADLADAGYLERVRVGRRNAYRLRLDGPMRHPVESGRPVRTLVDSFAAGAR
jgi:DNA-binding transcriptional ArsR family regulator